MSITKNPFILAGVDGSELGEAVIDYAIWLTKKGPTTLKLLHTIV